jgi:hypothetical protein
MKSQVAKNTHWEDQEADQESMSVFKDLTKLQHGKFRTVERMIAKIETGHMGSPHKKTVESKEKIRDEKNYEGQSFNLFIT